MYRSVIFFLVVLVGVAYCGTAYFFRYQPLSQGGGLHPAAIMPVWDRWRHRMCLASFYWGNRVACSPKEIPVASGSAENSKRSGDIPVV